MKEIAYEMESSWKFIGLSGYKRIKVYVDVPNKCSIIHKGNEYDVPLTSICHAGKFCEFLVNSDDGPRLSKFDVELDEQIIHLNDKIKFVNAPSFIKFEGISTIIFNVYGILTILSGRKNPGKRTFRCKPGEDMFIEMRKQYNEFRYELGGISQKFNILVKSQEKKTRSLVMPSLNITSEDLFSLGLMGETFVMRLSKIIPQSKIIIDDQAIDIDGDCIGLYELWKKLMRTCLRARVEFTETELIISRDDVEFNVRLLGYLEYLMGGYNCFAKRHVLPIREAIGNPSLELFDGNQNVSYVVNFTHRPVNWMFYVNGYAVMMNKYCIDINMEEKIITLSV